MLEDLPILVLETISEYLAVDDPKRRSILALSLVSKVCNAATARERYRYIELQIASDEKMNEDVARLNTILSRGKQHRYIRRVNLNGSLPKGNGDGGDDFEDVVKEPTKKYWQSLIQFLSQCEGLKDVIWASDNQVPRCMLDLLQNQSCRPRLHVQTFRLQSLCQWPDQLRDVDADEYALATSPSLYSIDAAAEYITSEGQTDYNEEAVLQMVAKSTSNLREVDMSYRLAGNTPQLVEAIRSSRPEWRDFFRDEKHESTQSQGRLEKLAIRGASVLSQERLQSWLQSTNFSCLQSLSLNIKMDLTAFKTLIGIASQGTLANTRSLSLLTAISDSDQHLTNNLVMEFLSLLNPLESLEVTGQWGPLSKNIFIHHNTSLKKVHLSTQLPLDHIIHMRENCPNVEDLCLPLKRTHGDEQEVRQYRELGSFRRLARLTLLLDYTDPQIAEHLESHTSREAQLSRMKNALINSAVDEQLAKNIFCVILNANRTSRPGIIPTFSFLELLHDGSNGSSWAGEFSSLQKWTCQTWVCERKHADVQSNDVWLTETQCQKRAWVIQDLECYVGEDFEFCDDGMLYRPAWEANWPIAPGTSNWLHAWHSFPLCSKE